MRLPLLAQLSLKRSLTLLLLFATGFAFLSSYLAFLAFENSALRRGQIRNLRTQALVLSHAVAADLDFGGLFDSQKSLTYLASNRHVLAARIYDREGRPFATFPGKAGAAGLPASAPPAELARYHDDVLDLSLRIYQDGEFKGTLFIRSDREETKALFQESAKLMSWVGLGLLVLVLLVAVRMQREVSAPILELAENTERISVARDFSIRLPRARAGEIRQLTEAFNNLLDQVQDRDARLREYQEHLEEQVLRRSEQLLQAKQLLTATLDALPACIAILDHEGVILSTNQRWAQCSDPSHLYVHGARAGDAYLAFCDRVQAQPAEPEHNVPLAVVASMAGTASSNQLDYDFESPEGHRWFTLTTSRFRTADSFHVVLMHLEVTEHKLLENQLRQAQKLESIGQLAAGIAHEINTPTQYIGDNAVFLRSAFDELWTVLEPLFAVLDEPLPERLASARERLAAADLDFLREEIPKALAQSLEGVGRVSRIVSAMKDFSHPGSGAMVPTDLNRAIESTTLVCRGEWKYVAELELILDPKLPRVPCLPDEFNQVILNLLINAAHAIAEALPGRAQEKGRITVSTRATPDAVEILVADDGAGIPEAIRARIFDPFFTTKGVGKGTGQGLAIAYAVIVKKHGGTISVASDPGRGTTFTLSLPREQP